jgi:hypothetical protein
MLRRSRLGVILLFLLLANVRPGAAADTAVWLYNPAQWSEARVEATAAALPPGTRHFYTSLEDGVQFLPDNEFRTADVQRAVEILRDRFGIATHAMILQDSRWLDDYEGALRRVGRILELGRLRPEQAFAGIHVNVEPHTLEDWDCGGIAERRHLIQKLQTLLARIAKTLTPNSASSQSQARNARGRLWLSAALPWWIGSLSGDVPEAAPRRWFESVDEIVLTAYGEPGGPLVGGSAKTLVQRLEDARLWQDIPKGKGMRIGLATYEYANPAQLQAIIRELDKALGGRASYRGTAVFRHEGNYNAPVMASIRGQVRDSTGKPVARARIRVADRETVTNRCGRFELRGLASSQVELKVGGIGFQDVIVPVAGLTPGQEREMPPVVVERQR